MQAAEERSGCGGCNEGSSRRAFLRDAALALGALGFAAEGVAALPVRLLTGLAHAGRVTYPLPAQDGALIDEANVVILMRWQNAVYAFSLSCPHQRTALRWNEREGQFRCPKHKSTFEPDGALVSGKAKRPMDRHPLSRSGSDVVVDTTKLVKATEDVAAWKAAMLTLTTP